MGGFGFRMPQYGMGGGNSLPDAPRFGPAPYAPHGGVYGGGNGGVMPYQQNPYAETIGSLGQLLQGIGAMKAAKQKTAQSKFEEGLRLKSLGLPVDDQQMIKWGRESGLPFDFKNGMAQPQLGGQQPQQGPQQGPFATQPGMSQEAPQGPGMPPPNPAMQMPPQQMQTADSLPMRQMNPMAMQGRYSMGKFSDAVGLGGPQQSVLGKVGNFLGFGSAPINPASAGVQAVRQRMNQAQQMGQMQRTMQGMEMQSKVDEFQLKDLQHSMLLGLVSGKLQGPEAFKAKSFLANTGVYKILDLEDTIKLAAEGGTPEQIGDALQMSWQAKDMKSYVDARRKVYQDAIDAGHSDQEARVIADDSMRGKTPRIAVNASAEQQERWAKNRKTGLELYPGLDKWVSNPFVAERLKYGDYSAIRQFIPGLKSKPELDAEKDAFGMDLDSKKFKHTVENDARQNSIAGYNATTSRMNAGTAQGQLAVAQGGLDLRRQEFAQKGNEFDFTSANQNAIRQATLATKRAELDAQFKAGKITLPAYNESMAALSMSAPNYSFEPGKKGGLFESDTHPQLILPPPGVVGGAIAGQRVAAPKGQLPSAPSAMPSMPIPQGTMRPSGFTPNSLGPLPMDMQALQREAFMRGISVEALIQQMQQGSDVTQFLRR